MSSERWRQLQCSGDVPTGRIGHTLVTNTEETTVYLYGGVNDTNEQSSQYLQDFFAFEFSTKSWKEIPMSGDIQLPRAFHTAVYHQGQLFIFGGCNGRGRFNKLFSINPAGVCVLFSPPPSAKVPQTRYCHSATMFEGKMYVFAGKCGGRNSNKRLKDMFVFDFDAKMWAEIDQGGADVPARSAHAAFTCGRRMVMFGGRSSEGECCEDLYHFSYDTHIWVKVETSHGPLFGRARHSVVVHNGRVVIFGGWNGKKKLNDLIFYNMDSETTEVMLDPDETCPSRRECHVAVTCQNTMVVFGGRFRGIFMNDTCELDLGGKSLKDHCRDWLLSAGGGSVAETERQTLPRRVVDYLEKWKSLSQVELRPLVPVAPPQGEGYTLSWFRARATPQHVIGSGSSAAIAPTGLVPLRPLPPTPPR